MDKRKMKKLLILNLPYFLVGLFATNLGEAWRLAEGADSSAKILSFFHALPIALNNPLPSFHPLDLLIGILCGAGLRLAVYLKGKNAKKYRHNVEYGSARWGTAKDIEPFIAPKFEDNVILTKTERLMMSNRPKNPANARNKNVLIIGGSGSGKTRFWLKPNLLQMHSSYVVTDPKGSIVIECGNALLKHGYTIKIFNTINFQKSMHYNPFAYIHSEKDILKLVTTLIANTKGDGKAGDEFWTKAETLLYRMEDKLLKYFPAEIEKQTGYIHGFEADIKTVEAHPQIADGFCGMEIMGKAYTEKADAGEILLAACKDTKSADPVPLGSYRGFQMELSFDSFRNEFDVTLKGAVSHRVALGTDARGNITRLDNALAGILERLERANEQLNNLYNQQEAAKAEVGKPFPQEAELTAKSQRLAELDAALNMEDSVENRDERSESERPSVLADLKSKAEHIPPAKYSETREEVL